jgi:nitrate/nitrite transport system permease protein
MVALWRSDLMPTPAQALVANLDFILNPFYERGPGDLGLDGYY